MKNELISLLSLENCIQVNFDGLLSLKQTKDGQWRIYNQVNSFVSLEKGEEFIYSDLEEAVDKFIEIDQKRKLSQRKQCE